MNRSMYLELLQKLAKTYYLAAKNDISDEEIADQVELLTDQFVAEDEPKDPKPKKSKDADVLPKNVMAISRTSRK